MQGTAADAIHAGSGLNGHANASLDLGYAVLHGGNGNLRLALDPFDHMGDFPG